MSIINQTLRELDARKTDSVSPGVSLHPVASAVRRRSGLWGVGAALLSLAGLVLWLMARPADPVPQVQVGSAPRAVSHTATPPASTGTSPAAPAPERLSMQPSASAPPEILSVASPVKPADAQRAEQPVPDNVALRPFTPPTPKLAAVAEKPPAIRKNLNRPTAEEEAEERYRKAIVLIQKGRESQARPQLEEAVRLVPGHIAARQVLATLLSEAGQNLDAEAVLREGRAVAPANAWFALSLARLQAARGDAEGAAVTLQGGLEGEGVDAEYRATLAALLLRLRRHPEAAQQYAQALKLRPDQGAWWMGLGLSLEAQGKTDEARSAYRRALATGNLPDRLQEFVRAKNPE
jgi:MSHA biogenesis protein MshN